MESDEKCEINSAVLIIIIIITVSDCEACIIIIKNFNDIITLLYNNYVFESTENE